ncbi:DUF4328 domain-containing protein [uncultured Dokdonia sp.]|uniref:DUF4328 domain-containing protein n=1 Tax=uncultured Dokdonia sp. TaxID=575653 RepID=UPI002626B32D|nr:DUF4328 domain-containing protein [uncultured Dokdonia sp.]
MYNLRPNDERSRIAVIFLIITIILDLAYFFSDITEYNMMEKINDGIAIDQDRADIIGTLQGLFAIAYTVLLIVTATMFIRWFRRAYYNLSQIVTIDNSEGWAAGAWFVPIYNLFKPKQIMDELWEKTNRILSTQTLNYIKQETNIISIWWALWIISGIGNNIATRMYLRAETAEEYMTSISLSLFMYLFSISSAIAAIFIIKRYSKMEYLLTTIREDTSSTLEEIPISL